MKWILVVIAINYPGIEPHHVLETASGLQFQTEADCKNSQTYRFAEFSYAFEPHCIEILTR